MRSLLRPLALSAVALLLLAASTKEDLSQVVAELKQKRKQLSEVKRDEREATRLLSDIDQARYRAKRQLKKLNKQITVLEKDVGHLRNKVEIDHAALEKLKTRVRSRLRALAQVGDHGYLRVLLSASSLDELAVRRALLARVAAHDAALLQSVVQGKVQLKRDRTDLEERYHNLVTSRDTAQQTLDELEQARQDRAAAILDFGAKRGALEMQVELLRKSQRKLRQLIWSKTKGSRPAVGLAKLKGQLPWPLRAPVEKQKDGSAASGLLLRASLGTKVRSVAEGRVVHAGFLRGYGLLVILDHEHSYHSLYAHLSRHSVEVGATVKAGDLIGYVGDSESLDGAKLYFELRRGGRPVNPKYWLQK